MLLLCYAAAYR